MKREYTIVRKDRAGFDAAKKPTAIDLRGLLGFTKAKEVARDQGTAIEHSSSWFRRKTPNFCIA